MEQVESLEQIIQQVGPRSYMATQTLYVKEGKDYKKFVDQMEVMDMELYKDVVVSLCYDNLYVKRVENGKTD